MSNRKVVLYIGISLDGYIATKDDSLEWLLNTQGSGDNGFGEFYDTVETIIMGRRTYDWIMEQENGQFPYIGKECYVYTTRATDDTEYVKFTTQSPENLIAGLKKEGKVTVTGFATFVAKEKAATTGRNPRTGETVTIPAKTAVTIKAGAKLKEALN